MDALLLVIACVVECVNFQIVNGVAGAMQSSVVPLLKGKIEYAEHRVRPGGPLLNFLWQNGTLDEACQEACFHDISMVKGTLTAYAVAEGGIVAKTEDGKTWTTVLNEGFPSYYYGVYAFSETSVIVSGFTDSSDMAPGVLRWSRDGGKSWTNETIIDPHNWAGGPIKFDATQKYGIMQSAAGSATWITSTGGSALDDWVKVVPDPNGWHQGNFLFDGQNVTMVGASVVRSADAGETYTASPPIDSTTDGGIASASPAVLITGGGTIMPALDGYVHRTTDGGDTWSARVLTTPYPVRTVLFVDDKRGFAVGGCFQKSVGGIYSTTDAGENWSLDLDTGEEMGACDQVTIDNTVTVTCVGAAPGRGGIYSTTMSV